MNQSHHSQRRGLWLHLCILLVVLAALASVRPAQAAMSVRLVKDINSAGGSSLTDYPYFTAVGSTLFFVADEGVHGAELWKSDGTAAGTILVKDINSSEVGFSPSALTAVGNTLFFVADDGVHGAELWKSDGTAAGTTLAKDINPIGGSFSHYTFSELTAVDNRLFFVADDGMHGLELWTSDGTAAATTLVKDINSNGSSAPVYLTAVGGTLFFVADDDVPGRDLWKSDGTAAGTILVKDFYPNSGQELNYSELTAMDATLFFVIDHGTPDHELWRSDGTAAGTRLVKNINRAGEFSTFFPPSELTVVGSTLFFVDYYDLSSGELWKSDGTTAGTTPILTDTSILIFNTSVAVSNALFFVGANRRSGWQWALWKSDGSTTGTIPVAVFPSSCGYHNPCSIPEDVTAVGSRLFFVAQDSVYGLEPWTSDGTSSGTMQIQDLNPGAASSFPHDFTRLGTTVFFSAQTLATGRELWATELPYHQVYLPLMGR